MSEFLIKEWSISPKIEISKKVNINTSNNPSAHEISTKMDIEKYLNNNKNVLGKIVELLNNVAKKERPWMIKNMLSWDDYIAWEVKKYNNEIDKKINEYIDTQRTDLDWLKLIFNSIENSIEKRISDKEKGASDKEAVRIDKRAQFAQNTLSNLWTPRIYK